MNMSATAKFPEYAARGETRESVSVTGGVADEPTGFEPFFDLAEEIEALEEIFEDLRCLCDEEALGALKNVHARVQDFEPTITMIGQVKAGKTSLVNAMIGRPEFLPADVNPWTSVVTSLHLNTPREPGAPAASFQLFNRDEWDNLVKDGGRLGELSRNANADDELRKIHAQIAEMREKTRGRLGKKFELLLGQKHDFDAVSEDLIQSYVCMGDDPAIAGSEDANQGRFADITRAADLYLDAPHLPMPFCLRDTPGVNDTFLMREQITINALRSSRFCVVVLSAHQALTTTDMAMIRMISNVEARDLVIFVNRIDELPDPAAQIEEIQTSIRNTLAEHNGPKNAQIVFGSAYWANMAIQNAASEMDDDSAASLMRLAESTYGDRVSTLDVNQLALTLSGVPALFTTLGERISKGIATQTLDDARRQAQNIARGLMVSTSMVTLRSKGEGAAPASRSDVQRRLATIEEVATERLHVRLSRIEHEFAQRIERSRSRFIDRALETLLQHLETKGSDKVWHYSADGLRMLLRSSFLVLAKNFTRECGDVFSTAAQALAETYQDVFQVTAEGFSIEPPAVPNVPPPVTLGATIALDLHTSWWRSLWLKSKGAKAQAERYYKLIEAETAPLVEQLHQAHVSEIRRAATETLSDFLTAQSNQLLDVCDKSSRSSEDVKRVFGVSEIDGCEDILNSIIDDLTPATAQEA